MSSAHLRQPSNAEEIYRILMGLLHGKRSEKQHFLRLIFSANYFILSKSRQMWFFSRAAVQSYDVEVKFSPISFPPPSYPSATTVFGGTESKRDSRHILTMIFMAFHTWWWSLAFSFSLEKSSRSDLLHNLQVHFALERAMSIIKKVRFGELSRGALEMGRKDARNGGEEEQEKINVITKSRSIKKVFRPLRRRPPEHICALLKSTATFIKCEQKQNFFACLGSIDSAVYKPEPTKNKEKKRGKKNIR